MGTNMCLLDIMMATMCVASVILLLFKATEELATYIGNPCFQVSFTKYCSHFTTEHDLLTPDLKDFHETLVRRYAAKSAYPVVQ